MKRLLSKSEKETIDLGKKIARLSRGGDVIALVGELGSGKTTLAKGIALGLGIKKKSVHSPTFVLINEYPGGRLPLYHFDLYRLNNIREIEELGYEEYFAKGGLSVIEWAEKMKELFPAEYLRIELILQDENERRIRLIPHGARYQKMLRQMK